MALDAAKRSVDGCIRGDENVAWIVRRTAETREIIPKEKQPGFSAIRATALKQLSLSHSSYPVQSPG